MGGLLPPFRPRLTSPHISDVALPLLLQSRLLRCLLIASKISKSDCYLHASRTGIWTRTGPQACGAAESRRLAPAARHVACLRAREHPPCCAVRAQLHGDDHVVSASRRSAAHRSYSATATASRRSPSRPPSPSRSRTMARRRVRRWRQHWSSPCRSTAAQGRAAGVRRCRGKGIFCVPLPAAVHPPRHH
jgi:hypothetical protein